MVVKNTIRKFLLIIYKSSFGYFDIPVEIMKSKTRKREIVQANSVCTSPNNLQNLLWLYWKTL